MSAPHIAPGSTFAVVDIGSNTAKVSVYACTAEGGPAALAHDADTVRIGWRVAETGMIAEERLERLLDALERYEALAKSHGVTTFAGVATQAFRIAANAGEVLDAIHTRTSWRIRVIDPDEETRLTVDGARPWLPPGEPSVVADIGGASTELISLDARGDVAASGSIPIGSGLLYDRAIAASPPPPGSVDRARDLAREAIDASRILPQATGTLLLPGGTGQFLKLLLESLQPGSELAPATLSVLREWLVTRPAEETMRRIPVQLDRAQVLPASLAVVEALVLRIAPQRLDAIPSGIRDGIARRLCPVP